MKIWHKWTLAVLFLGAVVTSVIWSATISVPAVASPQQTAPNRIQGAYAAQYDQEQQYLRLLGLDRQRLHRVVHLTKHVRQLQHKLVHLRSLIHARSLIHSVDKPVHSVTSISTGIPNVWRALVQCEASGNWHIATGNGYYGGPQFSLGTYHSFHGVGMPQDQSPSYQLMIARRVLAAQGVGAWPVCGPRVGLARGD